MIRSRLAFAGLLLVGLAAAALIGQETGYGQGTYGAGPYDGPGDIGPDGMGPGGADPGMEPRGRRRAGRGDMGPDDDVGPDDGFGPYGVGPGGPRGMGRRRRAMDEAGPGGGGPGMQEASVKVQGAERSYYVHVPANVAKPAPLVLVFHGGNGRPRGIARKSGWNEAADQNGFIVVYPEGSPTPSGRGGTWNVGGGANMTTASVADDKAYVEAVLADVRHNAQVDPARIYAAGHSMGGVFAYRLACEVSDTFAAIGVVSSTMVEKGCNPTSPVAVLHIHGDADSRIPLAGGHGAQTARARTWPAPQAGVATWAKLDACSPQPSRSTEGDMSCETYDHCRAAVQMCVRAGGEHPWPEGATSRVWAFFAAHPKVAR